MRTISIGLSIAISFSVLHGPAVAESKLPDSYKDGSAAARLGPVIYNNTMNPPKPLPLNSGNVVPDTVKNLGAGQNLKDAFSNAASSNAGINTPPPSANKPPVTNTPPPSVNNTPRTNATSSNAAIVPPAAANNPPVITPRKP